MTYRSRDKFDLDFSEIHEAVYPADVRATDRIVARIRKRESDTFDEISVWKISPLGVELVDGPEHYYDRGDKVDLEITVGGQRSLFEGLVVDLVQENEAIRLIGIRLSSKIAGSEPESEKRRSIRWICSDEFYPTCVSPTPGRFNEYIYFQIRDISKEGFQLICSLRNKYLIPGTQLNLTVSFPMIGDLSISVTITRIGLTTERGKDYLVVGTEFSSLSRSATNIIGQYLLQFTDAENLEELKDAGFVPTSMAKGTDFYFLKSESDYEEVLNLRLLVHHAAGTVEDNLRPTDMGDLFDTNTRIIIGKHKGEIIASARIYFNTLEEPMEHESYIDWPSELPRRDQIFEISRACTHPKFRSGDLMGALLRFISTTCVQPQRPWIVISSTDTFLHFYESVGFKQLGITYDHPIFNGKQHVLLANAYDMLLGRTSNPIYWNAIWRDVYGYLVETGILKPEPMDRARLKIYKLMYPIAQVWFRLVTTIRR